MCLLQATPLDLLPQLLQQLQRFLGHQRQGQAPRAHPLLEQFHGDSKLLVPLHAIAAAALRVPPAEQPDQQLGKRLQAALMELLAGALLPDNADALAAGGAALAYAPCRGIFWTLMIMVVHPGMGHACNSGICGACSRSCFHGERGAGHMTCQGAIGPGTGGSQASTSQAALLVRCACKHRGRRCLQASLRSCKIQLSAVISRLVCI